MFSSFSWLLEMLSFVDVVAVEHAFDVLDVFDVADAADVVVARFRDDSPTARVPIDAPTTRSLLLPGTCVGG